MAAIEMHDRMAELSSVWMTPVRYTCDDVNHDSSVKYFDE